MSDAVQFKYLEYTEMICISDNTVSDVLSKNPDTFVFLFEILQSQVKNPERFIPIPKWFNSHTQLDMPRFICAVSQIKIEWKNARAETDLEMIKILGIPIDAYMLSRFMILSCPYQLECVNKIFSDKSIQQYKVTWTETDEQKWEKTGAKLVPEYLYHGSRVSNWYSILKNGIKVMSGTAWMSAGAAYGVGIYCSNDLALSWGYSNGGTGPIIIGVYEIWNADMYKKTQTVFVIPDENKLHLRYLIYMPVSNNVNVAALNTIMHENWIKVGTNKAIAMEKTRIKINARILKEIKLIRDAGLSVEGEECVTTEYNGVHIKITFPHQFPFSSPTIKYMVEDEEVQLDTTHWNPKCSVIECIQNALK